MRLAPRGVRAFVAPTRFKEIPPLASTPPPFPDRECARLGTRWPRRQRRAAEVRSLFPSDHYTVLDLGQNTFRRVKLPKPDCSVRPSDCADIDVLNKLDGFNLQPRLTIPFDEPIDVSTVSSDSVFLVSLGSTLPGGPWPGHVVGINQVVWDSASLTLYAETDELLDQHTRYLFVVTDGVQGPFGRSGPALRPLVGSARAGAAGAGAGAPGRRPSPARRDRSSPRRARRRRSRRSAGRSRRARRPRPTSRSRRAATRRSSRWRDLTGIVFRRQVATATFSPTPVPTAALAVVPGAVGRVAFGRYDSPELRDRPGHHPAAADPDRQAGRAAASRRSTSRCSCRRARRRPRLARGAVRARPRRQQEREPVGGRRHPRPAGHRDGGDQRGRPRLRPGEHAGDQPRRRGLGDACPPAAARSTRTATTQFGAFEGVQALPPVRHRRRARRSPADRRRPDAARARDRGRRRRGRRRPARPRRVADLLRRAVVRRDLRDDADGGRAERCTPASPTPSAARSWRPSGSERSGRS